MQNERDWPVRKRNRMAHFDYSACGVYFITVCTADRKKLFWSDCTQWENLDVSRYAPTVPLSAYGRIVRDAIEKIPQIYPAIALDRYVVMPDHIHLLLRVRADALGKPLPAPTMSRVMQQLKGSVSRQIGAP